VTNSILVAIATQRRLSKHRPRRGHSSLGALTPIEFADRQGDRPLEQVWGSAARPLALPPRQGQSINSGGYHRKLRQQYLFASRRARDSPSSPREFARDGTWEHCGPKRLKTLQQKAARSLDLWSELELEVKKKIRGKKSCANLSCHGRR
jgi:hypothetical protein